MKEERELIKAFTRKDMAEYLNSKGVDALSDECNEVTKHIKQLVEMMSVVIKEHSMACIVGAISVHVECFGAGQKVFEAILGRTSKVEANNDQR